MHQFKKTLLAVFTITVICGVCRETDAQNEAAAGLGPEQNVCDLFWVHHRVHHRMGVAPREPLRKLSIIPLKESV